MTPVAGRIPDGEKQGKVLLPCLGKSLLSPGIPVYRVMGMLEEVWTLLVDQPVIIHADLSDVINVSRIGKHSGRDTL